MPDPFKKLLNPETSADRAAAVERVMAATEHLGPEAQEKALASLGPPDQRTTNTLWVIVVAGLVLVSLAAVGGLIAWTGNGTAQTDKLVTVITTALAGLVGLFVPSPVSGKG
jgi:uncharacterized membrane protein YcjF (UPF0283 family)